MVSTKCISDYDNVLMLIRDYETILKRLEQENKNCENIDVILNSQIAGVLQEKIDNNIKSGNMSEMETEDLLDQFNELKDYFADIQVNFEMHCKCRETTDKEKDEIYERHDKKVIEREGIEYLKKAYVTAALQLEKEEIRKRGR